MLRQFGRDVVNPRSRIPVSFSLAEGEDHQSPEVYMGYPTSASGIPALTAGASPANDVPGTGTCDVYTLDLSSPTSPVMRSAGFTLRVYNFSEEAFSQNWLLLTREKSGAWIVAGGTIVCPS